MTIAVVGSSNFDFAAKVAKLPTQGQTVVSHNYRTGPGGKGCNQAFAVARLGVPPIFISKIGDDLLGRQLLETLTLEGLDTTNMVVANEAQTGIALISIDDAGENMITVVGGANMTMSRSDLHERQACLRECDYLLLQLECPVVAVDCAIKYAREGQAKIILDPAPVADLVVMRDLLALTHIVTPNQSECSALTGIAPIDEHSARAASDKLHEMGPETVVLKMGGAGAFYSSNGQTGMVPGFNVNTIDTVGAGDCFNGGLAVALHGGQSLHDAVGFACATGALATTSEGAADAAPLLEDVLNLIESRAA
ncbi:MULTISPECIES: ribokinase [unclassified Thalassospira]|uniref:ribokinase n=1 Tax=unclassified Thalassospira TaxID=2648997 RepID=UPI000EC78883|nr:MULTISPECIES: ribokinase [unclassified Thalassospira]HAI33077.1 ribokinase [Thalassospira sp.]|tara:strand:- start:4502 stop:5428 length:927 start_codon:yes stop_codon:yes gene_type:complete